MASRSFPSRARPTALALLRAIGNWCAIIMYLAARNAGERFRNSNWRILIALLEPLALVAVISAVHVYLLQGPPPFGTSHLLFNATGFLPYYIFVHVSLKIRNMDAMRTIPHTTWLDHALAYVLGELYVKGLALGLLLFALYLYGVPDAAPRNPLMCILPLCLLGCLGLGVGMINLVIMSFWKSWAYIYGPLARGMMMLSGVLYVVDLVPYNMKVFCSYNPLALAIMWLRDNVYDNYPAQSLDLPYLLICVAALLLVAFLLEENTREWRTPR